MSGWHETVSCWCVRLVKIIEHVASSLSSSISYVFHFLVPPSAFPSEYPFFLLTSSSLPPSLHPSLPPSFPPSLLFFLLFLIPPFCQVSSTNNVEGGIRAITPTYTPSHPLPSQKEKKHSSESLNLGRSKVLQSISTLGEAVMV